jgi:SAM-dependent methyltransferase
VITYSREAPSIWDDRLIDPLSESVESGDRVLDLCSGPGPVGRRLLQNHDDIDVVFADLMQEFLVDLPGPRVRLDAHRLPFAPRSFDTVIMRQGLHYCRPKEAVAEMARVSARVVAIGNVVMDEPSDIGFWASYASVVTPARHVFLRRGQVREMLLSAGVSSVVVADDWGVGVVQSSIRHLSPADRLKSLAVFERQPSDITQRYRIEKVGGVISYQVPWEFSVGLI